MAAKPTMTDAELIKYILACKSEAKQAKQSRMDLNKDNYAMFQLEHDFTHKRPGQSTEVLPKVRMAVESTKSFFQQALADITDWYDILVKNSSVPEAALPIKPYEAKKLLTYFHQKSYYFSHVGSGVQSGLLGALIITKTDGKMVSAPKFTTKKTGRGKTYQKHVVKTEDKSWTLCPTIIRQEDYYPDPTGQGLYELEETVLDLHQVISMSKGDDAIYDSAAVNTLSTATTEDVLRQGDISRETGQDTVVGTAHRPKVKLLDFWGTVVNSDGDIIHENIVMTLANDTVLIRKPCPNPLWHQESPYTTAAMLEVSNSVWPVALMDAPTKLNRSIIELNNLIFDAAFKQVHAPSQIRVNDLVDVSQVSNGIEAGIKLQVKSSLPHGTKVMEPLEEVKIPPDALNVLNIYQQEFNAASLSNDLRQGVMPFRAVKATEVVEASQSITSVFQGIAKNIESRLILPELQKQLYTIAQHWDEINKDIFIALFGEARGTELSQLEPQEVFVSIVNGYRFEVYGITQTLSRSKDYQRLTTLLQTISASDILTEAFMQKYGFDKFLGEVMTSLGIDKHKLEIDMQNEVVPPPTNPMEDMGTGEDDIPTPGGVNGQMSGIQSASNVGLAEIFGTQGMPQTDFSQV